MTVTELSCLAPRLQGQLKLKNCHCVKNIPSNLDLKWGILVYLIPGEQRAALERGEELT